MVVVKKERGGSGCRAFPESHKPFAAHFLHSGCRVVAQLRLSLQLRMKHPEAGRAELVVLQAVRL